MLIRTKISTPYTRAASHNTACATVLTAYSPAHGWRTPPLISILGGSHVVMPVIIVIMIQCPREGVLRAPMTHPSVGGTIHRTMPQPNNYNGGSIAIADS